MITDVSMSVSNSKSVLVRLSPAVTGVIMGEGVTALAGEVTADGVVVGVTTLTGEVTAVGVVVGGSGAPDVVGTGASGVEVVEGVETGRGETIMVIAAVAVISVVEVSVTPKVVIEVMIVFKLVGAFVMLKVVLQALIHNSVFEGSHVLIEQGCCMIVYT